MKVDHFIWIDLRQRSLFQVVQGRRFGAFAHGSAFLARNVQEG
jgi:hypothetical protein